MKAHIKYAQLEVCEVLADVVKLTFNNISLHLPREVVPLDISGTTISYAVSKMPLGDRKFDEFHVDIVEEGPGGVNRGYYLYHCTDYTHTGEYYLVDYWFYQYGPNGEPTVSIVGEDLTRPTKNKDLMLFDLNRKYPNEVLKKKSTNRRNENQYFPVKGEELEFEIASIYTTTFKNTEVEIIEPEKFYDYLSSFTASAQAECWVRNIGPFFVHLIHLKVHDDK